MLIFLVFSSAMMGAVLHTVNVRLFEEQLAWIINHAEDKVLHATRYMHLYTYTCKSAH